MSSITIVVIFFTLGFSFLNGIHDSSSVVATMISSRALPPRVAMGIAAIGEFSGPLIFGVAVANTIGRDIVIASAINMNVILAAVVSAILWDLLTWYLGFPSSSSHALVGGLIGSVAVGAGWKAIQLHGLITVLIALFTSPFIGFIVGYLLLKLIFLLSLNATPRINTFFKRGQVITSVALALSHGANDGQKTMGIVALALVIGGYQAKFSIPLWVKLICAGAIALGTYLGGWRLIRTLGGKFYKIRPGDGFTSQLSSAVVILGNSLLGGPVSTTQVVSSAIMGVGAGERINKVRWEVAQDIAMAWLLTIPATALVAAGLFWVISRIIP